MLSAEAGMCEGSEKRLGRGPLQVIQMLVEGKKRGPGGAKTASRADSETLCRVVPT